MTMSDRQDGVLLSPATEQRKYSRFTVNFPVLFGDGVTTQAGTVLDISREGCRIRCAGAAPGVRYFHMEIQFDEQRDRLQVDLAVMRWSRQSDIGVEFIRMTPDDQDRLRTLIQGCEEEASLPQDRRQASPKEARGQSSSTLTLRGGT